MNKKAKKVVVKDKDLPKKESGKVKGGIGLLLPAVQAAREAARSSADATQAGLANIMQKV